MINCKHLNIMVEKNMMDAADPLKWHNKPHIMENTRDVIFDWARGIARNSGTYPPNHTYPQLAEYEISLRERVVVRDEDYFKLRQEKLKMAYDHPLDRTAIAGAAEFPAPTMRLMAVKEFMVPRYNAGSDEIRSRSSSASGTIRDRLGSGSRGHGARGHGGHGGGDVRGHGGRGRGGHDVRAVPYYKGGRGRGR